MNGNELLQLAQALSLRGEPYAMVTVVRAVAPTSAYVGAQAIVLGDGSLHGWVGGGCARSVVVKAALDAIRSGAPKLVLISNDSQAAADVELHRMPCASNGEIELFIHPQVLAPLMLILGATPAAAAARELAGQVGFRVTDESAGAAPHVALVATQGDGDESALEAALASTAQRVLLIASARKSERLRDAMRLRGVSDERLSQLEAPAGPDIGARTPAEVALAAVSGAVAWWRNAPDKAQFAQQSAAPSQAPPESGAKPGPSGRYVDPVCGMAVDPDAARHVIDYEGARFHFCCDGCKLEFERDPARYAAVQENAKRVAASEGTSCAPG